MAGIASRNDDELDRVNAEVNADGDHQAITTATNEEVAIIITNEPNGRAKSAQIVESTSRNHGECSKVVQGPGSQGDKAFKCCPDGFCEMVGRHKARNEQLSERESELRQRLATLESWIPAVTLIKMLTGEVDSSNIYNIIDEQAMTMSTSNAHLHTSLSQHKDSRIRDIEAERKEAHRRLEEARKLLREKQSAVDERAKQIEEAQRKHISLQQKIGELQEQFERDGIDLMKVTSCESIASFGPDDLAYIIKLEELVAAEEHTKHQVEELERREMAYMKTLRAAGHIIPKDRKHPEVDELRDQLEVKSAANQQMADRICLLEDQVENLKGKLARCNHNVEQLTATRNKQELITKNGGAGDRDDGKTKMDKAIMAKSTTVNVAAGSDHDTVKRSERGVITRGRTVSKETLTRVERTDRSVQELVTDNERTHEQRPTESQNTRDHSTLPSINGRNTPVSGDKLSGDQSVSKKQGEISSLYEKTPSIFSDTNKTSQSEGRIQQPGTNSDYFDSSVVTMSSNDSKHNMRSTTKRNPGNSSARVGSASVRFERHDASRIESDVNAGNNSVRSPGRSRQSEPSSKSFGSAYATIDPEDDESNIRQYQEHGMPEMDPVEDSFDQSHSYVDIPPMTSPQVSFESDRAAIDSRDDESNIRQYARHGMPEMAPIDDSVDQSHSHVDFPPMTSPPRMATLSSDLSTSVHDSDRGRRSTPGGVGSVRSRRIEASTDDANANLGRRSMRAPEQRSANAHGRDDTFMSLRSKDSYTSGQSPYDNSSTPASPPWWNTVPGPPPLSNNDSGRGMGNVASRTPPRSAASPGRQERIADSDQGDRIELSRGQLESWLVNVVDIRRQISRCPACQSKQRVLVQMCQDLCHHLRLQSNICIDENVVAHTGEEHEERPPRPIVEGEMPPRQEGIDQLYSTRIEAAHFARDNSMAQRSSEYDEDSGRDVSVGYPIGMSTRIEDDDAHSPPRRNVSRIIDCTNSTFSDINSSREESTGRGHQPRQDGTFISLQSTLGSDSGEAAMMSMSRNNSNRASARRIENRPIGSNPSGDPLRVHTNQQSQPDDNRRFVSLKSTLDSTKTSNFHEGHDTSGNRLARRQNTDKSVPIAPVEHHSTQRPQPRIVSDVLQNPGRQGQIAGRIAVRKIEIDAKELAIWRATVTDIRRLISRCPICCAKKRVLVSMCKAICQHLRVPSDLCDDDGEGYSAPIAVVPRPRTDPPTSIDVRSAQQSRVTADSLPHDGTIHLVSTQFSQSHDQTVSSGMTDSTYYGEPPKMDPITGSPFGTSTPIRKQPARESPRTRTARELYDSPDRSGEYNSTLESNRGMQSAQQSGAAEGQDFRITDSTRYGEPPKMDPITGLPFGTSTPIRKQPARESPRTRTARQLYDSPDRSGEYNSTLESNRGMHSTQQSGAAGGQDFRITDSTRYGEPPKMDPITGLPFGTSTPIRKQPARESPKTRTARQLYDSPDRSGELNSTLESNRGMHSAQQSGAAGGPDFRMTDSTRYDELPKMDPITGLAFGVSTPIRKQRTGPSSPTRNAQESFHPDVTGYSRSHDQTADTTVETPRSRREQSSGQRSGMSNEQHYETLHSTRYGEPPTMDPITGSPFGTSTPKRRKQTEQSRQTKSSRQSTIEDEDTQFLDDESSYMKNEKGGRLQYGLEEMPGRYSSRRNYTGTSIGPMTHRKAGKGRTFDESNDKKMPVLGGHSGSQDPLFQGASSSPYVLSDSGSQRDLRGKDDEEMERWRMAETRCVPQPISREESKRMRRKEEKESREYREPLRNKNIISETERSSISDPYSPHVPSIRERSCCSCPFTPITRSERERSTALADNCRPCSPRSFDPVRHKLIDIRHKKTKQDYPEGKLMTMSSLKSSTADRRRDVNNKYSSDFECEVCNCEPCGTPSVYHSNPDKAQVDGETNVSSRSTKRNGSVSAKKARTNG